MGDFYMCVRKEDGYIVIRKCGPPGRGGGQIDGGGETRQIGKEKSGDQADENKGLFLQKNINYHCTVQFIPPLSTRRSREQRPLPGGGPGAEPLREPVPVPP